MTVPSDRPARPRRLDPGSRVHLVGIGGAGMSALARILLERGHPVSGSDLRGGRAAGALAAMGADVRVGHDARHVEGADVVAASTAVPADNPERRRAAELGIPVVRRAELLAALMHGCRRLLVAGTHGKTTTTSMVAVGLQAAGLDPSFAIGGTIHDIGTSAHHGSGELFVAEVDESDRSFLVFEPDCAVVTNVELDHHDQYADLEEVLDAFAAFLARRHPAAPALLCADDAGAMALAQRLEGPVSTYGEAPAADLRMVDVRLEPHASRCTVLRDGACLGELSLRVPGRHNLLNALAAIAASLWAGAGFDAVVEGLAGFSGAQRRFQRIGTAAGVSVVDDYAHHPSELAVTIAAARQTSPDGRIVAVFQPHLYSRTQALAADFGQALAAADLVVVSDVYGAREAPVPGVTGALVADAARRAGVETHFVPATGDIPFAVADLARDGDLVVTLGAGDITEAGPQLLRLLADRGGRHG